MYLSHALRAIVRTVVVTGDALWKYVTLLISGTPPAKTFIYDASNNNASLTLNGDTRPSNFSPYTQGYYSNFFDGSGDTLNLPSSTALLGSGSYTVEFWVNLPAAPTGGAYFTAFAWGSSGSVLRCFLLNETVTKLGIWIGATNVVLYPTSAMVGQWAHIALVRSGTTLSAYINGVSVATASDTTNYNTGQLYIASQAATNFLTGFISNFRIVTGSAVYTANFTPPTAPLTAVANTSLLTCQSSRLIDNSQNNFAITRNGDVSVRGFAPFTPPTSVNVNTLYSTYFDGSGDYLSVPNNAALTLGAGNFTVECWFYITGNSASNPSSERSGQLITKIQDTSNYYSLYVLGNSTITGNALRFEYAVGGATITVQYTATIAQGQWHHLAVVRNGSGSSNVVMYLNGTSVATATITATDSNTGAVNIGYYGYPSYPNHFYGYISNARVVKGTAVYTANFTPPTAPLTAISGTSLLTCQDSTLKDNSTNAFTITSFGQAQPIPVSPFTQTTTAVDTTYLGSGYFDGTGDYLSATGSALGAGAFTIEMWVHMTSYPNGQNALYSNGISDSTSSIAAVVYINSSGTLAIYNYPNSITTSTTVPLNQWNHIAVVRNSGTINLYINGVSGGSGSNSNNITDTAVQVMRGFGGISNSPVGYVTDVRVVKGTALYTANFAPPLQPLTAVTNTSLLTLQTDIPAANKQFVDNSGSNLSITQFGNATQGTFSPYGSNWSNYFDGSGDYINSATAPSYLAVGTGAITLEAWVYITQTDAWQGAVSTVPGDTSGNGINIGITNTNKLRSAVGNGGAGLDLTDTADFVFNTWVHIAVTRAANGAVTLYKNGISVATGTSSTSLSANGVIIGRFYTNLDTNYLRGYISNVRISNTVRTITVPTVPYAPDNNTLLLTCQSASLIDTSNRALPLTRGNDVSVRNFSPFSPVTQTPVSYSATFGSTGYLTSTTSTAFPIGTENFTVEMWLYKTNSWTNNNQVLLISSTSGSLQIWVDSGLALLKVTYNSVSEAVSCSTSSLAINTWYHFAVTRSGNNFTIYINGTSVATGTNSASFATPSSIIVANYTSGTSDVWNGYISNLRIVRGTAVYTANFTPPTAPLTAISGTSLLTCQSPTIVDNSPNALAITGAGNVIAKTFHPFGTTSYSQYFDGTGDYLSTPSLISASGDFTLECWFNTTTALSGYRMLCGGNIDTSASNYAAIYPSGFEAQFGSGAATVMTAAYTFAPNTWYHVAMTRSGTTVKVYVNGVSLTTSQGAQSGTFAIRYIGIGYAGLTYTGYISNLRFVTGSVVYTANFAPPTAPLIAVTNTALLTCQNLTAIDNSPNAFTITKNGDVSGSLNNPFPANAYTYTTGQSYTPALYGGSAYFDGTGDYLSIVNTPSLNLASVKFTIEAWVYINNYTNFNIVFAKRASSTTSFQCYIVQSTGIMAFQTGGTDIRSSTAVPLSQWCHLAWVYDGTNINQYLNGVRVNQTATSVTEQAVNIFVGYDNSGGSAAYLNGYIADVRVVKGDAVYVAGFVPPAAPLQAVKNTALLLNMDKAGAADSSRNTDLETVGDAKIRYETPYAGSYYSNYFDGSGDYLSIASSTAFGFGTGDFTIEFWAYSTSTSRQDWVDISDGTNRVLFYYTGSAVTFYGNGVTAITGAALVTNAWVHYALVKSSGSTKLYVNGTQAGSTYATNQNYGTTAAVSIGKDMFGSTYITGNLSNFRVVKGTAVYTTNFTPSTTPLTAVANTSLLTCQSKSFVDNSTNNFTITKSGDTAVRAFNPFQATTYSSMFFDGTGDCLKAPYNPSYSLPGDFTVEAWINLTSAGGTGNQTIASFGYLNSTGVGPWGFYLNGSGPYTLYFNSSSGNKFTSTTVAIPVDTWNHVVYCRSGGTGRFFVNGTIVGTTISDTFTYSGTNQSLFVGSMSDGTTASLYGYVADLRITQAARYTANFTPPTAPLPTA
jgi:hypothetical protein